MSKADKDEKESVKLNQWIRDNFVQDQEICKNIAKEAIQQIYDCFRIRFTTDETVLAFYSKVYDAIMDILWDKRSTHSEYAINIADRVEFGYVDNTDEDMEKVGSFVPYIYNLDTPVSDFASDDISAKSIELCTEWATNNVKSQIKTIHDISVRATKLLAEVDIPNPDENIIIPCFVKIHEAMVAYLKHYYDLYHYKEDNPDTYELNVDFCGNFNVVVRKDAENQTVLEIAPNVASKIGTKDDAGKH